MGLFNKNNKDDEYLTVLGEIRDNLKYGIDEDRFDTIIRNLETRITDVKSDTENELCSIDDTINGLVSKVDELEKTVNLQTKQLDENYTLIINQNERINHLVDVVKKYAEIIKIMNEPKVDVEVTLDVDGDNRPVKEITKKEDGVIIAYNKKWKRKGQIHLENIVRMNEKGKFIGKSRNYTWDINNLIRLKKYMKQSEKYPTFTKLAKAVGVNQVNVVELGYYILNGDFDKYFNEWEQIQADNTFKKYGNWKPSIENNPEKRKEKGYV